MGELTTGPRVARELIPRLPRTFGPALNDQLRNWELLFPAERRVLEAQLNWLAALSSEEFSRLFSPIVSLESKMDLPRWDPKSQGLSIEATGILARSPLYPQWRKEVEAVFATVDAGVEKSGAIPQFPHVLVCVLPPGLPLANAKLWPDIDNAHWMPLDRKLGELMPSILTSLRQRTVGPGLEPVEGCWVFESDSRCGTTTGSTGATVLSWAAIEPLRREFLTRLNTIRRTLTSVDETNEGLRKLDISPFLGNTGKDPRVREFVRALLLSGNGSLIFGNSFVQWGAAEALRRVQPQALVACFGIRPKLKPFSSTVLFEDQSRSNPVPDEDDPGGSLVDAVMLANYVRLAAERLPAYNGRTMILLGAWELDKVAVLGGEWRADLQTSVIGWLK